MKWGTVVQTNITQSEVKELIKSYVDERYPHKVEKYEQFLRDKKESKLEKHSFVTFVDDGLMWQDDIDAIKEHLNILELKIYCRNLQLANRKDWRVPSYDEMLKLVDYEKHNPATKEKIEYILPNRYWSISKSVSAKDNYWYVDFKDGSTNFADDSQRYNIRCVREISQKAGQY